MDSFYYELEQIIETSDIGLKHTRFKAFYQRYQKAKRVPSRTFEPKIFAAASYASFCKVVSPLAVPKRKNPATLKGQALLLHSIAHIEYSAIDLALDHCYRFTGMPKAYYDDWLEVAEDEFRHFWLLHALLEELGSYYGAFPVHDGLFEAGKRTQTLLERMAVVPRYFEANGLDATPQILQKLETIQSDAMIERIVAALRVILDEEVDHVRKGDRWFEYACEKAGVDKSVYFEIIERLYPGSYPRKKQINAEARKAAGFSCSELNRMGPEKVC